MPLQSTCADCSAACTAGAIRCQSCQRAPLYVRFWRYVDKAGPVPAHRPKLGPCWLWTGATSSRGYGHISSGPPAKSYLKATHVSLAIHGQLVPHGYQALHRCDNPPCVNPAHLFVGTNLDNIADKVAKGRGLALYGGERHHRCKLTTQQVAEIRALAADGLLHREIAARYDVHRVTVGKIIRMTHRKAG